ncbi:Alpha/Beta hydrolase protein [Podospora didyma]|uniref:Alpha/Beta hydrolase protein n=1 Tax=Podospora didyma TaxID=330526 RepID=A0AAE0KLG4_9PEZI|nr:Alpha/Beta hydrolase protein [Podospora didyma]
MKGSLVYCFSALVGLAVASPTLQKRDVSTAELTKFKLVAQYAASAFCNTENTAGQIITCKADFCPLVTANNGTTSSTFAGSIIDSRGLIAIDRTISSIIISFRGSRSIRNWITDFIFTQVPCDLVFGCLVHTGFLAAWNEISPQVLAGAKAAVKANPSYKVIVTGHSLGGAVGTLATAYLRKAGIPVAELITFGSPRVGNSAFAKFVTDQPGAEYRLTHAEDPVPRLPPILFNYRHTSPEYWIDAPSNATTITVSDFKVCPGDANIACNGGTKGFDLTEHSIYFQQVNGCNPDGEIWKRGPAATISDADLLKQLNQWVDMDIDYVEKLPFGESERVGI